MKLFDKLFKKRKNSEPQEDIMVVIKTEKELTDEQKNTILRIVKEGIKIDASLSYMGMAIILEAGVYTPVILNKTPNGIEVII